MNSGIQHTDNTRTRSVIGGVLCGLLLVAGVAYIYSPIQVAAATGGTCGFHSENSFWGSVQREIKKETVGLSGDMWWHWNLNWYDGTWYNSRIGLHDSITTDGSGFAGYTGSTRYQKGLYTYLFQNTLFDRIEDLNERLLWNTAGTYGEASAAWDELEREYDTAKGNDFMFDARDTFTELRTLIGEVLEMPAYSSCSDSLADTVRERYRVIFNEVFIFHEYNKAELVALFEEQKDIYRSLVYMNYGREPTAQPAPTPAPAPETSGNEDDGTPTPKQPIVNEDGEDEEDTQSQIEEQPQTGPPAPPTSPALSGTHIVDVPKDQ